MISATCFGTIGRHGPEIVERAHSCFATFSLRCRWRGKETSLLVRVDGAARAAKVVRDFRSGDQVVVSGDLSAFTSSGGRLTLELRANSIERINTGDLALDDEKGG
jgi:hypothetical protein